MKMNITSIFSFGWINQVTSIFSFGWINHGTSIYSFGLIDPVPSIHSRRLIDPVTAKYLYGICNNWPESLGFFLVVLLINMVIGIPANIMVLWLIHRNGTNSSGSDVFILHLALLDTLFCLLLVVEMICLSARISFSMFYFVRFFHSVKDCSPLFLLCICLDRYLGVLHPIMYINLKGRRPRHICAGFMWFITLAYAVAQTVLTNQDFNGVFIFMILFTLVVMLFCNMSILRALRRSCPGQDNRHADQKRALKMVLIILAILVFNYSGLVLFPFETYISSDVFYCYIYYTAFGLMDISSSIQPFLYLYKKIPRCSACNCFSSSTERSSNAFIINS